MKSTRQKKGLLKVLKPNSRKQRIKIKGNNYLSLLTFMNQRQRVKKQKIQLFLILLKNLLLKNLKRKLKNFSCLRQQSLIERITVVLFIGAILLSPLIRENLELRRVGVKRRALRSIIEDFKIMFYELNIYYFKYFYNNYYILKYYFKYYS